MRTLALLTTLIAAAGCGAGADGPAGSPGPKGPGGASCHASEEAGRWIVECPDGSSAELDLALCEIETDGDEIQHIRCPDGTEATVHPGAGALAGRITGTVRVKGAQTFDGVLVEIVGLDLAAMTDSSGAYTIEQVPPGNYQLRFSRPSYTTQVVSGIVSLGGTYVVPEVTLSNAQMLFNPIAVSATAEIVLSLFEDGLRIHELGTGEIHKPQFPANAEFEHHEVHDDGSVILLVKDDLDRFWLGFWRPGQGISWHADISTYEYGGGGALMLGRLDSEMTMALSLVHRGVELPLEVTTYDAVQPVPGRGKWLVNTGEVTILLDAEGDETTYVEILDEPCEAFDHDETGDLAGIMCPSGPVAYDLARQRVVAENTDDDVIDDGQLENGIIFLWFDSDPQVLAYDAASGESFRFTADPFELSGPLNQWIWYRSGGEQHFISRDGKTRPSFSFEPEIFSPGETRFLGTLPHLRLVDIASGQIRNFEELLVDTCEWIDEDGAACKRRDTGDWILVSFDGLVQEIPSASFEIEAGWLRYEVDGRTHLIRSSGVSFDIGITFAVSFTEAGDRVVWTNWIDSLYAMNLETGETVRLATLAEMPVAYRSGVGFLGFGPPFGGAEYFVPFPW